MSAFEGFTREEVIRSGNSRIPCGEFVEEDHPCQTCACKSVCATGLSCQAFRQYLEAGKKKRMEWVNKLRIPTKFWFRHIPT